jgi:hypothetical protein
MLFLADHQEIGRLTAWEADAIGKGFRAGSNQKRVLRLDHYLPGKTDGVVDTPDRAHSAEVKGATVHYHGVHLDIAGGCRVAASASISIRAVFQRANRQLHRVKR